MQQFVFFLIDNDKIGLLFIMSLCLSILIATSLAILAPIIKSKIQKKNSGIKLDKGEKLLLVMITGTAVFIFIAIYVLLTREPIPHYR